MGRIALAASWLATTIGAAALGWLSTSYLDRGRPEVTISDVRPSPVKDEKARLDDGSARFIESSFL